MEKVLLWFVPQGMGMGKAKKTASELEAMILIAARDAARFPIGGNVKVIRTQTGWDQVCTAPDVTQHVHFIATVARIAARLRNQYDLAE